MPFLSAIPAFMAANAGWFALAGAGLSGFTSIMGGIEQSRMAGLQKAGMRVQSEEATYNANVAAMKAAQTQVSGQAQMDVTKLQQKREQGTLVAAAGKAGVTMEGSPLEVYNQNQELMDRDILTERYNTQVGVDYWTSMQQQQEYMAIYYRGAGEAIGEEAPMDIAGGIIGAGGTLLGGAYRYWGAMQPPTFSAAGAA
jgi:hypothetical protein